MTAVVCWLLALPAAALTLHAAPPRSDDGVYRLSWNADGKPVELQVATVEGFDDARQLYLGTDDAHVVSGQGDGTRYYRARVVDGGDWSEPVAVEVTHHGLGKAFGFFALGAFVFLATVGLLVGGSRADREGASS